MLAWPILVHHCDSCHFDTTVDYSATVWSQEHTCRNCSLSSVGADIAGRTTGTMNHSQHDELAALFAQRMSFETVKIEPVGGPDLKQSDAQPTAFISSHYIHPTYLVSSSSAGSEPSCSPPPSYIESIVPEAMAQMLIQNSIDPSALLPNQINLFANADYEQRLRLLELWRISPPSYIPLEQHVNALPTSMEQEETLARARYETTIIARGLETYQYSRSQSAADSDMHNEPMSPIRASGEPAWPPAARMRAASIAASKSQSRPTSQAEPYMAAGYRNSMQQHHLDPVYASTSSLWEDGEHMSVSRDQEQAMANQYGSHSQMRNYADWEASNQEQLQTTRGHSNEDYDMVM